VERVVDLERARVEALAQELLSVQRRSGSDRLIVEVSTLESVERWRRAARRAARLLGRRVHTSLSPDRTRVAAWFYDDRPVSEADRRRVALILSTFLRGLPPPRRD
jgi:hypothetical protein